jgi:hypothetical protein
MYGNDVFDDTVNIPKNEYEELLERSAWLSALEAAGVNSWEGWDEALTIYDERNEDVDQPPFDLFG